METNIWNKIKFKAGRVPFIEGIELAKAIRSDQEEIENLNWFEKIWK